MIVRLRCPHCRQAIPGHHADTGLVSCRCGPHPVIAGVPILEYDEPLAELVASIRRAGRRGAMRWLRDWVREEKAGNLAALRRLNGKEPVPANATFNGDWARFSPEGPADYWLVRWACPSYLSNLPLLPMLAGRRVLDLACGVGHLAHLLAILDPPAEVVAVDADVLHLLLLKEYFAPAATALGYYLEGPLPFHDAEFDAVVMNDAFHYVTRKKELLEETLRVLRPSGILLLLHVHDPGCLEDERVPGEPVEPLRVVEWIHQIRPRMPVKWMRERDFLSRSLGRKSALALDGEGSGDAGAYLVAGGDVDHPPRAPGLPDFESRSLFVNPIYRLVRERDYTLQWPDRPTLNEFGRESYLPTEVSIPADLPVRHARRLVSRGILIPDPLGRIGESSNGSDADRRR